MKRSKSKKLIWILLALSVFFVTCISPSGAYAAESTGNAKFDAFITNPDYEDDAEWGMTQHPKLSKSGSSGCASYCADFVKFCYGIDALTSSDSFTDPNQIRAGDVIHLTSEGSGHWFVVLKRKGNELYTAEGNWAERVRVGWCYIIEDGDVYGSRHSFDCGYHFAPKMTNGKWVKDSKGWKYVYGKDFYASSSWIRSGKNWYYIRSNGYMASGCWQKINYKWYYFEKNGTMAKKWKKLSGKWYYLAGGAMVTGWKKIDGKWYYFVPGGAMVTGWKTIMRKTYYFTAGGAMVTGTRTIDNRKYTFDKNGALISE